MYYGFSFPPDVYVGTLNLIASIPGYSILTLHNTYNVSIQVRLHSYRRVFGFVILNLIVQYGLKLEKENRKV